MESPIEPVSVPRNARVLYWRCAAWAVIAVAVILQGRLAIKNCRTDPRHPEHTSDFDAFYAAGKLGLEGQNIYAYKKSGISRRPFIYPPTFAVLPMMLVALLPHDSAAVLFTVLNYFLLFGSCWLLYDALFGAHRATAPPPWDGYLRNWRMLLRQPALCIFFAAILIFRFVDTTIRLGNANLFVLFPLVLALWLLLRRNSAAAKFSAGLAIAYATAAKVAPGLFGLYLLWTRRVWAMAGGAAGLLLFLLLVPGFALGFPNAQARLHEYAAHAGSSLSGEASADDVVDLEGAEFKQLEGGPSIRGTLIHYLSDWPIRWNIPIHGVIHSGEYHVNLFAWPLERTRLFATILSVLVLLATIALTCGHFARTDPDGTALSFGLVSITMMLISPLSRIAYLCLMLIAIAESIKLLQENRLDSRTGKLVLIALLLWALGGPLSSPDVVGLAASKLISGGGIDLVLLMVLYAAVALALLNLRRNANAAAA